MKIANLTTPSADYLVPEHDLVAAGSSVENVLVRLEVPFATDPVRLAFKDLVYLETALRAEREGYDAVFVNTVADYGLELIRASLRIPVAGAGEAGVTEALAQAPGFSIVTVWPSSTKLYYDRVLDSTASRDRLRSLRFVLEEDELGVLGGGAGVMASVHEPGSSVADRVLAVARDAVERDGAEAIVLGCSCMTRLTGRLRDELAVPVIDPLTAGFLAAQAAAMKGAPGQPDRAAPYSPPSEDTLARLEAMMAVWEPMGAAAPDAWTDDCGDVCATVA